MASIMTITAITRLDLPPGEKLTLLVLAVFTDRDNGNAFPSVEVLAERSGCSVRMVQYRLGRLVEAGYVAIESFGGGRRPRTYRLTTTISGGAMGCTPDESETQIGPQRGATDCTPDGAADGRGVQSETSRGATDCTAGVQPIAPDQYIDQYKEQRSRSKHTAPKRPARSSRALEATNDDPSTLTPETDPPQALVCDRPGDPGVGPDGRQPGAFGTGQDGPPPEGLHLSRGPGGDTPGDPGGRAATIGPWARPADLLPVPAGAAQTAHPAARTAPDGAIARWDDLYPALRDPRGRELVDAVRARLTGGLR
jgi:hypothetical protein